MSLDLTRPLDYGVIADLPNQNYWNVGLDEGANMEYFRGRHFTEKMELTRHYFVNGVPLYFLSVRVSKENYIKWVRDPFVLLEDALNYIAYFKSQGYSVDRTEIIPISQLNELHVSYERVDGETKETVHDYTNWEYEFDSRYVDSARLVFSGLKKEDQELIPEGSREILCKEFD